MVNIEMMQRILAYAPRKQAEFRIPLRRAHLSYRIAATATQLERQLRSFKPSVVLADVDMPKFSGADLLERVGDRALVILAHASKDQVESLLERLRAVGPVHRDVKPDHVISLNAAARSIEALHDPETGRLDARRTSSWFGVSLTRFSKFLGRSVQSVHKTPAAVGLQGDLAVFARIAMALTTLFGTPLRARIWLNAPHPDLDGASPISLLAKRKAEVVADLLEDALLGQPG